MTKLDCSVTSCMYNQDRYCSKGDITVGGSNATSAGETCCESFREKGSMSNSTGHPSQTIDVDCEATNCVHNEKCKCHATSIGIGGGSSACQCKETECADFRCR